MLSTIFRHVSSNPFEFLSATICSRFGAFAVFNSIQWFESFLGLPNSEMSALNLSNDVELAFCSWRSCSKYWKMTCWYDRHTLVKFSFASFSVMFNCGIGTLSFTSGPRIALHVNRIFSSKSIVLNVLLLRMQSPFEWIAGILRMCSSPEQLAFGWK